MTRSPFLTLPGAVDGIAPDAGVPAHYGEPLREQRALAERGAVVDLGHLGVVRIAGDDRLSWLASLSTQVYATGTSSEGMILSPQGRVEHGFAAIDDGEATYLITESAGATPLAEFLRKMRFMMRVEISDLSDELFPMGTFTDGTELAAAAPAGRSLLWHDPWPTVAVGGVQYSPIDADAHPARDYTLRLFLMDAAGRADIATRVRAGEFAVAGSLALEALRIAAWRPRVARELDERALPHEFDWMRTAVHLTKGCYRGQETVAKVHNLGHPPRRLTLLDLDGVDGRLPAPGALIHGPNGKPVGRLTSVGLHYDEGPIALALVKRMVDTAAPLQVELTLAPQVADGAVAETSPDAPEVVDAAQTVIVPPDAGDAAQMQELRRQFRR